MLGGAGRRGTNINALRHLSVLEEDKAIIKLKKFIGKTNMYKPE